MRNKAELHSHGSCACDLPLWVVMSWPASARFIYVQYFLRTLDAEIAKGTMAVQPARTLQSQLRDLQRLHSLPHDAFLRIDDQTMLYRVLGKHSPGASHAVLSRHQSWKIGNKSGCLLDDIPNEAPSLMRKLTAFLDPSDRTKARFRSPEQSVVRNLLRFMKTDRGLGTAFPPFHARFFGELYLPHDRDAFVADPAAGWGGRLLGALMVHRPHGVHYFGIDPEVRNKAAYDTLTRRAQLFSPNRYSAMYYEAFEDWISSVAACRLLGLMDLVITSPPYFSAEDYNPANDKQSAYRYPTYSLWRRHFYWPMINGAYGLLRPGGRFILNVANVSEAPQLERDALDFSRRVGFELEAVYSLALSLMPGIRYAPGTRVVKSMGKDYKAEPVFVFRK
jgi:hypothetical protein